MTSVESILLTDTPSREYLEEIGIIPLIKQTVEQILRQRPDDPVKAFATRIRNSTPQLAASNSIQESRTSTPGYPQLDECRYTISVAIPSSKPSTPSNRSVQPQGIPTVRATLLLRKLIIPTGILPSSLLMRASRWNAFGLLHNISISYIRDIVQHLIASGMVGGIHWVLTDSSPVVFIDGEPWRVMEWREIEPSGDPAIGASQRRALMAYRKPFDFLDVKRRAVLSGAREELAQWLTDVEFTIARSLQAEFIATSAEAKRNKRDISPVPAVQTIQEVFSLLRFDDFSITLHRLPYSYDAYHSYAECVLQIMTQPHVLSTIRQSRAEQRTPYSSQSTRTTQSTKQQEPKPFDISNCGVLFQSSVGPEPAQQRTDFSSDLYTADVNPFTYLPDLGISGSPSAAVSHGMVFVCIVSQALSSAQEREYRVQQIANRKRDRQKRKVWLEEEKAKWQASHPSKKLKKTPEISTQQITAAVKIQSAIRMKLAKLLVARMKFDIEAESTGPKVSDDAILVREQLRILHQVHLQGNWHSVVAILQSFSYQYSPNLIRILPHTCQRGKVGVRKMTKNKRRNRTDESKADTPDPKPNRMKELELLEASLMEEERLDLSMIQDSPLGIHILDEVNEAVKCCYNVFHGPSCVASLSSMVHGHSGLTRKATFLIEWFEYYVLVFIFVVLSETKLADPSVLVSSDQEAVPSKLLPPSSLAAAPNGIANIFNIWLKSGPLWEYISQYKYYDCYLHSNLIPSTPTIASLPPQDTHSPIGDFPSVSSVIQTPPLQPLGPFCAGHVLASPVNTLPLWDDAKRTRKDDDTDTNSNEFVTPSSRLQQPDESLPLYIYVDTPVAESWASVCDHFNSQGVSKIDWIRIDPYPTIIIQGSVPVSLCPVPFELHGAQESLRSCIERSMIEGGVYITGFHPTMFNTAAAVGYPAFIRQLDRSVLELEPSDFDRRNEEMTVNNVGKLEEWLVSHLPTELPSPTRQRSESESTLNVKYNLKPPLKRCTSISFLSQRATALPQQTTPGGLSHSECSIVTLAAPEKRRTGRQNSVAPAVPVKRIRWRFAETVESSIQGATVKWIKEAKDGSRNIAMRNTRVPLFDERGVTCKSELLMILKNIQGVLAPLIRKSSVLLDPTQANELLRKVGAGPAVEGETNCPTPNLPLDGVLLSGPSMAASSVYVLYALVWSRFRCDSAVQPQPSMDDLFFKYFGVFDIPEVSHMIKLRSLHPSTSFAIQNVADCLVRANLPALTFQYIKDEMVQSAIGPDKARHIVNAQRSYNSICMLVIVELFIIGGGLIKLFEDECVGLAMQTGNPLQKDRVEKMASESETFTEWLDNKPDVLEWWISSDVFHGMGDAIPWTLRIDSNRLQLQKYRQSFVV